MVNNHKIRVLVTDDSAFMRKLLTDLINRDDQLEVVAQARDGKDALQKIKLFAPDVVTLDVEMPVLDGLATLESIMAENPLPVIMLSAFTQAGAEATLKALETGAVDFVAKPGGTISPATAELGEEICRKIKAASQAAVNRFARIKTKTPPSLIKAPIVKKTATGQRPKALVLIGTSTGGPKALSEVMSRFSQTHDAAVLIVQHMPPGFTKSLAERLDANSVFTVKEAQQEDEILAGMAYVAPGDYQMKIMSSNDKHIIQLLQSPPVNGHRPSVDFLLNSAAHIQLPMVGVIMTGMGRDGAAGMKALKESGAFTICENEETSVVYGMPKAAIQLGAVDQEVPLYKIAERVEKALCKQGGGYYGYESVSRPVF